jgi:ATP-dependent exoDNAse (exonuclease V) alpha subunit
MTASQRTAFEWVKNSPLPDCCFISGPGGTGKSFLLKAIVSHFELERGKNVAVLATSGTAAHLINGQTAHRFFRLGIDLSSKMTYGNDDWVTVSVTDVIVIDEISMMSRNLLTAIEHQCRSTASTPELKLQPFGGKKIILFGDLYQLPPVLKGSHSDAPVYKHPLWNSFHYLPLRENCRQIGDPAYAALLNRIRLGKQNGMDLQMLETRICGRGHELTQECRFGVGNDMVVLTSCHKEKVRIYHKLYSKKQQDMINSNALNQLAGTTFSLDAIDTDANGGPLSYLDKTAVESILDKLPTLFVAKVCPCRIVSIVTVFGRWVLLSSSPGILML